MKAAYLTLATLLLTAVTFAQSDAHKTFTELQGLQGTWAGKSSEGMPVKVTFRDTADGSALLSEIEGHGRENMVSMFHQDNGRIL